MLVHYQPIIDLATERTVRAEALCRVSPEAGTLGTPAAFIAAAERDGKIRDFTRSMLSTAFWDRAAWGNQVAIAINLSFENLFESDLRESVLESLANFEADPSELTFELRDGIQAIEEGRGLDMMRHLAISGVRFSVDGFGPNLTAVSDLEIARLPISEIKIDANVIPRLIDGHARLKNDRVIGYVRNAGLDIVAKCVETPLQLEAARLLGCTHAQGYLLGVPLDSAAFGVWLRHETLGATG